MYNDYDSFPGLLVACFCVMDIYCISSTADVPLTVNAITRELALERVNLLSLVANLHLSVNKLVEIEQQPSHTDQLRATVEYWLSVDPTPSWRRLLCALDQEDAHAAAVKKVKPHVEPLTGD